MAPPRPVELFVPMLALGGVGFLLGGTLAGELGAVVGAGFGVVAGAALGSVASVSGEDAGDPDDE